MDVRRRIGANVQRLRRAKGLSQEELSDRADIHQTYLSGVEGGKRNPSALVLARIAHGLEVDVYELFAPVSDDLKSGSRSDTAI